MPKQKTHRASAKRFKRTGNGGLKRAHAFTSHRFHGKTKKQRRQLRKPANEIIIEILLLGCNVRLHHYCALQKRLLDRFFSAQISFVNPA